MLWCHARMQVTPGTWLWPTLQKPCIRLGGQPAKVCRSSSDLPEKVHSNARLECVTALRELRQEVPREAPHLRALYLCTLSKGMQPRPGVSAVHAPGCYAVLLRWRARMPQVVEPEQHQPPADSGRQAASPQLLLQQLCLGEFPCMLLP